MKKGRKNWKKQLKHFQMKILLFFVTQNWVFDQLCEKKIVEIWHQRNTKTNQVNGNELKSGQTKKARLVKLGKIVEHKI